MSFDPQKQLPKIQGGSIRMLDANDLKVFKAPFSAHEHEFRYDNMVYVTEEYIAARLDVVDPNWSFNITSITQRDDQIIAIGTLTVKSVSRVGVGMENVLRTDVKDKKTGEMKNIPANEPEKSASTDALKRAARLFGIGRYLLSCPKSVTNEKQLAVWLQSLNNEQATAQSCAQAIASSPTPQASSGAKSRASAEPLRMQVKLKSITKKDSRSGHYYGGITIDGERVSMWPSEISRFTDAGWFDDHATEFREFDKEYVLDYQAPCVIIQDGDYWKLDPDTPIPPFNAEFNELGKSPELRYGECRLVRFIETKAGGTCTAMLIFGTTDAPYLGSRQALRDLGIECDYWQTGAQYDISSVGVYYKGNNVEKVVPLSDDYQFDEDMNF